MIGRAAIAFAHRLAGRQSRCAGYFALPRVNVRGRRKQHEKVLGAGVGGEVFSGGFAERNPSRADLGNAAVERFFVAVAAYRLIAPHHLAAQ